MQDKTANLKKLRRQIDALDEDLLALLCRRQGLMHDVGMSKAHDTSGLHWRPQREMARLEHLLDKAAHINMPAASLLTIWQTIMAAALARQTTLTIYAPSSLKTLARQQFGAGHQYETFTDKDTLDVCVGRKDTLAILPIRATARWWHAPLPAGLAVIAALPLWQAHTRAPRAFCVASPQSFTHARAQAVYVAPVSAMSRDYKPLVQHANQCLIALPQNLPQNESTPATAICLGHYITPLQISKHA